MKKLRATSVIPRIARSICTLGSLCWHSIILYSFPHSLIPNREDMIGNLYPDVTKRNLVFDWVVSPLQRANPGRIPSTGNDVHRVDDRLPILSLSPLLMLSFFSLSPARLPPFRKIGLLSILIGFSLTCCGWVGAVICLWIRLLVGTGTPTISDSVDGAAHAVDLVANQPTQTMSKRGSASRIQ